MMTGGIDRRGVMIADSAVRQVEVDQMGRLVTISNDPNETCSHDPEIAAGDQ
jgi:hypothetical protein